MGGSLYKRCYTILSSTRPLVHPSTRPAHARLGQSLQKQLEGVLNGLLELLHKLAANGAVDDLVVKGAGDDNLVVPGDGWCAVLGQLAGDGDLLCCANGDDAGLGRVDDGGEALDGGVHAHVGDGDAAALVLLGLELAVAGALAEILDLGGDGGEAEAVDVLDNGCHEADGGGDGDGDVDDVVLADDDLAVNLAP